jgi:anti-sigma regulatory factor (Ser/Thr protein kinase)
MRSALSERHVGSDHEAGFYGSDEEFRSMILPFVEEGVAAGQPVILSYDRRKSDLLREWLENPSAVIIVANNSIYSRPALAIANYRALLERHVADGAEKIRIAGDVPHASDAGRFEGWDRYESAINVVWADLPVHALCLYDATTTSAPIRDVVERTHPTLLSPDGQRRPNARYQDPSVFRSLPVIPDPLEDSEPLVELADPTPAAARLAVQTVGRGRLGRDMVDDLLVAVSEAVTNALLHGGAPVTMRMWASKGRLVIHVRDGGRGPVDRLAGLVPAFRGQPAGMGLGLWLMHQLDMDVALVPDADGFTVRIRSGEVRSEQQLDRLRGMESKEPG